MADNLWDLDFSSWGGRREKGGRAGSLAGIHVAQAEDRPAGIITEVRIPASLQRDETA